MRYEFNQIQQGVEEDAGMLSIIKQIFWEMPLFRGFQHVRPSVTSLSHLTQNIYKQDRLVIIEFKTLDLFLVEILHLIGSAMREAYVMTPFPARFTTSNQ